jgi:Fur family peroxide stress response transcriptional regulator
MEELEPLRRALRSVGLRLTPQRAEVYLQMARSSGHPGAAEVHAAVRRRLPSISLDTVYRTLWKLTELGLLRPLVTTGDRIRFDAVLEPHHHFVCVRCGRTIDFTSSELDSLEVPEAARRLGSVWDAHLEARGICRRCSAEAGKGEEDEEG